MNKTSLIRVILFGTAIFANMDYLLFILDPTHADNVPFFIVTGIADFIAIIIFVSTWIMALYFEVSKHRYYQEIQNLRQNGTYLLNEKVAVLVPMVNEDLKIVRNTIESLQALRGEKEIYLLDDGRKPETQAFAAQMRIHYITRGNNRFFKAGNLNNAILSIREKFFIVVDADFALHPDFIRRTLPLFHDQKIAAVQTPQVYSNEETLFAKGSKYLQGVFYSYLQPGRSLLDSSMCVGTNVIYRKQAVIDVAGISEVNDSEDAFTTLKFMEHGYRVFFLDEQLAVGLSPTSLIAFYNQQFRWARGGFSMMLKHNTFWNRRLHPEQKIQFFLSNFFYLSGVSVAIYLVSPLVVVLFNVRPLNDAYFWDWLPRYALFFCMNFLFFMTLVKKYRLQSLLLGMFSFVPYINALVSVLLGVRFRWKPTNARSKGTITKLLSSYILYLAVSLAAIYLLLTGVISFDLGSVQYYFWFCVNFIIVVIFIINSYIATPHVTVPVFENLNIVSSPLVNNELYKWPQMNVDLSFLRTMKLSYDVPSEQKETLDDVEGPLSIENTPTLRLPGLKGKHR
jgi:cellulose synthase (UDP-forming)